MVSTRHAKEFRTNPDKAYKIKHATSKDGWHWTRDNKFGIIPEYEYESIMCACPSVLKINDKLYMFYNGNGFGETGIALTTMEIKIYVNVRISHEKSYTICENMVDTAFLDSIVATVKAPFEKQCERFSCETMSDLYEQMPDVFMNCASMLNGIFNYIILELC